MATAMMSRDAQRATYRPGDGDRVITSGPSTAAPTTAYLCLRCLGT